MRPTIPDEVRAVPIYEYRCSDCRRRVSVWWRTFSDAATGSPACPRCGGANLSRLISRVAVLRSEDSRLDDMGDPTAFGVPDEDDPRAMGRWMRRMSAEMGEPMDDEFSEVVGRLEAGESPEAIEQSMPDFGASPSALDAGD